MSFMDVEPSDSHESLTISRRTFKHSSGSESEFEGRISEKRRNLRYKTRMMHRSASQNFERPDGKSQHVTVQSCRTRRGRYDLVEKRGKPSKDEKYATTSGLPEMTFFHEIDELGDILRRRIVVDWWGFGEFLESLEPFPYHEKTSDEGKITFVQPFVSLFLRLNVLEKEVCAMMARPSIPSNKMATEHNLSIAQAILGFLEENASETRTRFEALSNASPSTLVQYDELWMLYRPGQLVFETIEGTEKVCYMVDYPIFEKGGLQQQTRYGVQSEVIEGTKDLKLMCWTMNYDANLNVFKKKRSALLLRRFSGGTEIANLRFVPEKCMRDLHGAKVHALSRGQSFWEMNTDTSSRFRQLTTADQDSIPGKRVIVGANVEGPEETERPLHIERVENWSEMANKSGKGFVDAHGNDPTQHLEVDDKELGRKSNEWFRDYDIIPASKRPDELVLMLCPRSVAAFSLRDKSWNRYSVSSLKPVQFADNAWSRLVLRTEYKDVIWAMVKSYLSHTTNFQDLVAGKGEGLVVLLHGPPGVGKTLTAECVAESFRKPLYMVTAGDLGTDPYTLEEKLSRIFDHAVAWDAILLLDEADIFLQDRDYDNLQRNALVSIFLRTLEYFNGIMFLTSNRVGAFDQAFQSRIHITIGMPEFDEALRKDVWKIFIKDLGRPRRHGLPPLLSRDECKALGTEVTKSWASQPLNGRQIRNCVRSALALAENEGVSPNASHFNKVINLGNAFTKYMTQLQKAEAEEIAQIKGDRLAAMKDIMARESDL